MTEPRQWESSVRSGEESERTRPVDGRRRSDAGGKAKRFEGRGRSAQAGIKGYRMTDDLAAANVNRSYQLAASSIAIFTFLLFFLYPRFVNGDVDALPFQATLIVMGVTTFSFAFASFYYYGASLGGRIDDAARTQYARRGDRLWLLGCVMLFFAPSLILFTVRLLAVASSWFVLWLVYVLFLIRNFPRVQTEGKS
jgi:hypothetical protein